MTQKLISLKEKTQVDQVQKVRPSNGINKTPILRVHHIPTRRLELCTSINSFKADEASVNVVNKMIRSDTFPQSRNIGM